MEKCAGCFSQHDVFMLAPPTSDWGIRLLSYYLLTPTQVPPQMLEQMQQHAAASLSAAFGSHAQQLVAGNNYLGAVAAFVG
jgi:hypothetical protein